MLPVVMACLLYTSHSAEVLNAPRAAAFADFERLGFPTRKMEKYKYTDVSKYFEPEMCIRDRSLVQIRTLDLNRSVSYRNVRIRNVIRRLFRLKASKLSLIHI